MIFLSVSCCRKRRFVKISKIALVLLLSAPASIGHADILDNLSTGFGIWGPEKYKTEIAPDIPAEDLYNQGLAKLKARDYEGAAKNLLKSKKLFLLQNGVEKAC